tara:strand:+ start:21848 stop:24175 length:2328 start_codon:yes stop_codon:yes gene_type:complete
MKKLFLLYFLLFSILFSAQTDYSDSWEDFYSYNNVKDFIKVDAIIYALSDNAVFTYNTDSKEINKISSVQGLSGETTTAIHYSAGNKRLVIGYENGLIEVIEEDGSITISSDIINFSQSGEKSINHISEFNNKLYLSTPFAVVVYDIKKLEFGDTYFIGENSASIKINATTIYNDSLYAATENGIFAAEISSDLLIDSNLWGSYFSGRNFSKIIVFNEDLLVTEGTKLYLFNGMNLVEPISFTQPIVDVKSSSSHVAITLSTAAIMLNLEMEEVFEFSPNSEFNFTLNTSFFEENTVFLGTKETGILTAVKESPNTYSEIHPEGPLSNDVFSITAQNNKLWVVYGGYNGTFTPMNIRKGYSYFNGESWLNEHFNENLPNDLVHVTIDPKNENRVYMSALGVSNDVSTKPTGGLLVVEDTVLVETYNHLNSSFSPIVVSLPAINIRVSGSVFDRSGALWATNYETAEELVKFSASGQWSSISLKSVQSNAAAGLTEIVVDRNNSIWIGSRGNGVYVYNENGDRKKALITAPNSGNLPDLNVRTIAIDANNRVWIGTQSGLVVYGNASGVFDDKTPNASSIVINGDENGFGERLLGDQTINSIAIDGADNKWFGTDKGGALYTNPSGQTTLANFSKQNSPLPSNRILKIKSDERSGKVYFATTKGIVAYNSKVAPFGENLGAVYAYPNPALKSHEIITIDGRNGTHLPKGTNVKIIDIAGNLVYETNVVEGQQLKGGKVVWDKRNLAGKKVASGIYIVLLSNDDASETSVTKIAIVN